MDYPLVSIITSCFNGESYLVRYFQSILNQTYPHLELIFVNDGSTDKTEEIVLSYQQKLEERNIHFIYIYQENTGQAAALNRGLKIFKGDYLTWPDSDDIMTADCIEKKVSFLINHPDYKMVRSNGYFYNELTKKYRRISYSESDKNEDIFEDLLVLKTYGCCGCYMITRDLFLSIYPQRTIFNSREGQNWQLLVPCASYSQCGYIDENLYIIYEREISHSRQKRSNMEEMKRLDNFKEILIDAIERSRCDKNKYLKLVCFDCARKQFYYAIDTKNKSLIKEKYKLMKLYGRVNFQQRLLYIKYVIC